MVPLTTILSASLLIKAQKPRLGVQQSVLARHGWINDGTSRSNQKGVGTRPPGRQLMSNDVSRLRWRFSEGTCVGQAMDNQTCEIFNHRYPVAACRKVLSPDVRSTGALDCVHQPQLTGRLIGGARMPWVHLSTG